MDGNLNELLSTDSNFEGILIYEWGWRRVKKWKWRKVIYRML